MSGERRQHPRQFVRIMVDYAASDTFLYDYSNDLSEGGIFIQTSQPLEKGSTIDLRFTLPGVEKVFALKGEVMWVNCLAPAAVTEGASALDDLLDGAQETAPASEMPEGMGVRFVNISPEEQALLREFLSRETY